MPTTDVNEVRPTHVFWLVQRLEAKSSVNLNGGISGRFGEDYMGSSEFEFGAKSKSLKRIRAEGPVVIKSYPMTYDGGSREVFVVAHPDSIAEKAANLVTWLAGDRWAKEQSYFPEQLSGKAADWQQRTIAWWSLEDDVAWALDETVAGMLADGFNNPPK